LDSLGTGDNLADILFDLADPETGEHTAVILRMLLVDKFGYKTVSCNLSAPVENPEPLAAEFAKWKAVDLVAAYHHPDLGIFVANPKIAGELAGIGPLRKRELLVIYAGKGNDPADDLCVQAAQLASSLFDGARPRVPAALYSGKFITPDKKFLSRNDKKLLSGAKNPSGGRADGKAAVQGPVRAAVPVITAAAPAITRGPVRMTPMYSVAVQNELFHNGNVEAWKRIIASYNAKHPELTVYIYYEGERILDINSLFKWGKVKHGSSIQFAVAGNEIRDVAKLQRYLVQGASREFEAFLHGPVSTTLKLF
jgi:hypothetical protein